METSSPEVAVATKTKRGKNGVPFFFLGGCLQKGMEMLVFVVWRGALLTCFLEVVEILFDVMCFFISCGFILLRFLGIKHNISTF